jgi:hypothetical protein
LGLLDILGGIFYFLNLKFLPLFFAIFLKGVWSFVSAIETKDIFFILLSILDLSFSLLAILSIRGIEILAFLLIAKGLISLF